MKKKILVTGCSRSGTLSVSRMLMQLGLDTPHEHMGKDGTVSCYMFEDSPEGYPHASTRIHNNSEQLSKYEFDIVVHLYRDPLKCIPSNIKVMNKSHQRWLHDRGILNIDDKPKILRMMQMWFNLNETIEQLCECNNYYRFNIRDAKKMISQVATDLDLKIPRSFKLKHMHKGSGYLKADKTTYAELKKHDAELADSIKAMYRRYEEGL